MISRNHPRRAIGWAFIFVVWTVGVRAEEPVPSPPSVSYEQLNQLEQRADQARRAFWQGDIAGAAAIFRELGAGTHASTILYLNELGICHLARGDTAAAEPCLREVARMLDTFIDQQREKVALSRFGKEEAKLYHGDPYEQSTAMLLLALAFLDRGDFDNALAACKTGILADADATESRYECDYTLLYLVEAKCHWLRGEDDLAVQSISQAVESYRITSPQVREAFSERQDLAAQLRMSAADRKRAGIRATEAELQARLAGAEGRLASLASSVDDAACLSPLKTGVYNTLLIVPRGRAPYKTRVGKDAELVLFQPVHVDTPPLEITIDDQPLTAPVCSPVADIEFQATTRGGRRMDAILRGKAAFRDTTVGVGSVLTEVGNQTGGLIGLGIALVGVGVQAVGGAVTPEADTRCWQTLPQSYDVYALDLPPGSHTVRCRQFRYFCSPVAVTRQITLGSSNDVAVIFAPPSPVGLYSELVREKMRLAAMDTNITAAAKAVLVPPPMGIERIQRFEVPGDPTHPLAIAPDLRRVMRTTKQALAAKGWSGVLVTHEDAIARRSQLAATVPYAIQVVVEGLTKEGAGKSAPYAVRLTISLIDTADGQPRVTQTVTGRSAAGKTTATDGFYSSIGDAMAQFLGSTEFSEKVDGR